MPLNLEALRNEIEGRYSNGAQGLIDEALECMPSLARAKFRPHEFNAELVEKILAGQIKTSPAQESFICNTLMDLEAGDYFDNSWQIPIVAQSGYYRPRWANLPDHSDPGSIDPLGRDKS